MSCTIDAQENGTGNNSIPVVWIGDTSEPFCKQDKTFQCQRQADAVTCEVQIAQIGANCTESNVTAKLHGLCCSN